MDAQWWLLWLGLALAAGVLEVFSLSLVFAMIAAGALAGAAAAALTDNPIIAVLTFSVTTGLLLVGVRPVLLHYSRTVGPPTPTGVAALVGRRAQVLTEVTTRDGSVKLAGEIWTARTDEPGTALEVGSTVYVVRIDGATAVVAAQPPRRAIAGNSAAPDDPPA